MDTKCDISSVAALTLGRGEVLLRWKGVANLFLKTPQAFHSRAKGRGIPRTLDGRARVMMDATLKGLHKRPLGVCGTPSASRTAHTMPLTRGALRDPGLCCETASRFDRRRTSLRQRPVRNSAWRIARRFPAEVKFDFGRPLFCGRPWRGYKM